MKTLSIRSFLGDLRLLTVIVFSMLAIQLAAWLPQSVAHHEVYETRQVVQTNDQRSDLTKEQNHAANAPRDESLIDRQIAFFEYEMLMHLALNTATPSQKAIIALGYADHQFVENTPGCPNLDDIEKLREQTM